LGNGDAFPSRAQVLHFPCIENPPVLTLIGHSLPFLFLGDQNEHVSSTEMIHTPGVKKSKVRALITGRLHGWRKLEKIEKVKRIG
jgi:hypothetical protein